MGESSSLAGLYLGGKLSLGFFGGNSDGNGQLLVFTIGLFQSIGQ
jgi:hypothetical protein